MARPKSPKALAIRICAAMHEIKGADLHWVRLSDLCEHMELPHSDAFDEAIAYARKEDLLSCSPPPIHSVMLTHKGDMAARRARKL
jgi:hypothetical protein